jgi:hypothetical protein
MKDGHVGHSAATSTGLLDGDSGWNGSFVWRAFGDCYIYAKCPFSQPTSFRTNSSGPACSAILEGSVDFLIFLPFNDCSNRPPAWLEVARYREQNKRRVCDDS